MNYYKIIQNNKIIDIGSYFIYWNQKRKRMLICPIDKAQFVYSANKNKYYRDSWFQPFENVDNIDFQNAKIIIIEQNEYQQLSEMFLNDSEIIIDEPEQVIITPEEPEQQEQYEIDALMTIGEMRQKIINQEAQIQILTQCVLELSEIVYA